LLDPLLRSTASANIPAPSLGISPADANGFVKAATRWVEWQDTLVQYAPQQADTWQPARLEHEFEIQAGGKGATGTSFVASSWNGDRLDWFDLDAASAPPTPSGGDSAGSSPSALVYPGMPAARYWQFDDGRVNFGQIDLNKDDLARMLVVDFACAYSNDWYLIPCRLSVGALYQITSLRVLNNFDNNWCDLNAVSTSVNGSSSVDWCMFRPTLRNPPNDITTPPQPADGLLLLPTSDLHPSTAIEEIHFLRDEVAAMAWAVEAKVQGADGFPIDRYLESVVSAQGVPRASPPGLSDPMRYQLISDVPANWFPLVPELPVAGEPEKYQRLTLEKPGGSSVPPLGQVLRTTAEVNRMAVPQEGCRVSRRYVLGRGTDGKVYLWASRLKSVGRGEGASGLRFDRYDAPG
jgi:hypothetical protein